MAASSPVAYKLLPLLEKPLACKKMDEEMLDVYIFIMN